jgi:hypothetical protein
LSGSSRGSSSTTPCAATSSWPRWLYFNHAVGRDYLPCGNTGSTSSTPRAATTSSSGRIVSTIHLD